MAQAATLETLLFKATNPSNKLEDVNTIKQFCDLVNKTNANGSSEGSVTACRILAHKIQSPQVILLYYKKSQHCVMNIRRLLFLELAIM